MDGSVIAIVGLGLMGGSLAAALVEARATSRPARGDAERNAAPSSPPETVQRPSTGWRIRGVARRPETIAAALERGFIDEGACDPVVGMQDADLVVFGAPARTTIDLIRRLAGHFKPGCIVTDLGSTKRAIAAAMAALPPGVDPIGGHPMCGKEVAGLEAAEASLFQGRAYILTPLERTSDQALATMQELIERIGARAVILTPERHDRLTAAISHLPYVLSACLVNTADDLAAEDAMLWELASSGFRDMSRLAASEPTMMQDILLTNQEHIRQMIDRFQRRLSRFEQCLARADEPALATWMRAARQRREEIFP